MSSQSTHACPIFYYQKATVNINNRKHSLRIHKITVDRYISTIRKEIFCYLIVRNNKITDNTHKK